MRNEIKYLDYNFSDITVESGTVGLETSLPMSSLGIDTLEVSVQCADRAIVDFEQNTPITWYRRGGHRGMYFVQSITRTGPDRYAISAISSVGRLEQSYHFGGIYTGKRADELIADICGEIPVEVKTSLAGVKLYGYLPIATRRANLAQVLFAISAYLTTDQVGNLRVEGLFRGLSAQIGADKCYTGGSVEYADKVTSVVVLEHQYISGGDETQLFEGVAEQGQRITFDQPMSALTATGFAVLESGANYAIVSGGSGALTGRAYIHTTREIVRAVNEAAVENVQRVEDATLVTLANSNSIADRLRDYYRSSVTITQEVTSENLKTGQYVEVFDPFDRQLVTGTVETAQTELSATLRTQAAVLVGFQPPEVGGKEYYDFREVLTSDSTWTVPEGVTEVTAVVIGGGRGGWSGLRGGECPSAASINYTGSNISRTQYSGYAPAVGGAGGAGGAGGEGGRIARQTFSVSEGEQFAVFIGRGGSGGTYSSSGSQQGSEGTASTFGSLSSASGSPSGTGYVDPITGERYASTGRTGIAGGKGSGGPTSSPSSVSPSAIFVTGSTVTDRNGNTYSPGRLPVSGTTDWRGDSALGRPSTSSTVTELFSEACFGLSGGAAVGANGSIGGSASGSASVSGNNTSSVRLTATCTAGRGGTGATASAPAKATEVYGGGGDGGNGGGGAGGSGAAYTGLSGSTVTNVTRNAYGGLSYAGSPGAGSRGGEGADGCVILYYAKPKPTSNGAVLDSSGRFVGDKTGRLLVC